MQTRSARPPGIVWKMTYIARRGIAFVRLHGFAPSLARLYAKARSPWRQLHPATLLEWLGTMRPTRRFPDQPAAFLEPHPIRVEMRFDRTAGTLTVLESRWDRTSGQFHVADCGTFPCFSGCEEHRNNPASEAIPDYGPIPAGVYYVDNLEDISSVNPHYNGDTLWFPLISAASGTNGVWVQDARGRPVWRFGFYLHPGTRSTGCVTIPSATSSPEEGAYPTSPAFDYIKQLLNRATPTQKGSCAGRPQGRLIVC